MRKDLFTGKSLREILEAYLPLPDDLPLEVNLYWIGTLADEEVGTLDEEVGYVGTVREFLEEKWGYEDYFNEISSWDLVKIHLFEDRCVIDVHRRMFEC